MLWWRRDRLLASRNRVATIDDPAGWVRQKATEIEYGSRGVSDPVSQAEAASLRSVLVPPAAGQVPGALRTLDEHLQDVRARRAAADKAGEETMAARLERHGQEAAQLRHRVATAGDPAQQLWWEAARPGLLSRTGLSAEQLRPAPQPAAQPEATPGMRQETRTSRSATRGPGAAWPMPTKHALAAAKTDRQPASKPGHDAHVARPYRGVPER